MTTLAQLTTLRVGGPVGDYLETDSEEALIAAVTAADADAVPLLVIGGGSNLLASDEGFAGRVVRDARSGWTVQDDGSCGGASVTVAAGTSWDELVAAAVAEEWVGLEALSGIPGSVGAAPVQNIGAYGAELSQTFASARVWDRVEKRVRTLFAIELGFGYRDSILKRSMGDQTGVTPRHVVLDATFQMRFGTRSAPVGYDQLATALGVAVGDTASTADVREAVLGLRRSKGMVLDDADHDTWSAGSFFTNPVVAESSVPAGAPTYPAAGGVKTSAAWLIEHAGLTRGFALPGSAAALSTKHTLALTNRGGATSAELTALARHVRDTVREAYGIELVPEPSILDAHGGLARL